YGFNQLQETGLTHLPTIISLAVSALALIAFVIRQLRLHIPILELRVFKVSVFINVVFISILAFSLLISIVTILPMFVHNAQQHSPFIEGRMVVPAHLWLV